MKSLFSKLLPLFFVAMLGLAPLHAQAQSFGPSGPRDGMFDCLGDLDWGCKIIGFIFETSNNEVTYVKDGQKVVDQPTPVMQALRGMMGFFSNALLIVASIKLLYELLQMTAETAHTGQVGGKNANKLWAPIRLVIAIGLLVPLDSGLNSGQYIVLQIAKWGSGLASQGWKVFVTKLTENQTLSAPTPARIYSLSENVLKIYVCKYLVNTYAQQADTPDDSIGEFDIASGNINKKVFGNDIKQNVCGEIAYKIPNVTGYTNVEDARSALLLTRINNDQFNQAKSQIESEAKTLGKQFYLQQRNSPTGNLDSFLQKVQTYQTSLKDALKNSGVVQQAMNDILTRVQDAANTRGWTSAGTWFLAITRAQGQIITGGLNIPEASEPDIKNLPEGPGRDYAQFVSFLQSGKRTPNNNTVSAGPNIGLDDPVTKEDLENQDIIKYLASLGGATADKLLGWLDIMAARVGLWTNDPQKAFGDLGGSTNPFGEIASLGHRKIRLALDYFGLAILTSVGGAAVDAASGLIPGKNILSGALRAVGGFTGKVMVAATALVMMIATLFLLAGILLAFIVPLFPFTRFFFAIITWIGSLLEAMILVPFMSLAFLTPNGEGFSGPNTNNAFSSILQVFLRPILCTFGLIASMVMFYIAAKFLNGMFFEATSGIGVYTNTGMRFVQKLVYSVVYVGMIYSAANMSFKMIEHIPQHALGWMGRSAKEQSYDDHQGVMSTAAAISGGQGLQQLQKIPGAFSSPINAISDASKSYRDSIAKDKAGNAGDRRHNELLAALSNRGNGGSSGPSTPSPSGGPRPGGGNSGGTLPISDEQNDPRLRGASQSDAPTVDQTGGQQIADNGGQSPDGQQVGDNNGQSSGNVADGSTQRFNSPIAPTSGRTTQTSSLAAQQSARLRQPLIQQLDGIVAGISGFRDSAHQAHVTDRLRDFIQNNPGATREDVIALGTTTRDNYRTA